MSESSRRTFLSTCMCMLMQGLAQQAPAQPTEDLRSLLRRTRERNRAYHAPSSQELRQSYMAGRALLSEIVTGHDQGARSLFQDIYFNLVKTQMDSAPAIGLCEAPSHRRGGGVYVFRQGAVPRERVVQVPHSFFDVGTLDIGIELAITAQARALFVNTVHRYQGASSSGEDSEDESDAPADLAHQEKSFFQELTRAALDALPRLQVIQVHGFADGRIPGNSDAAVVASPSLADAGAPEAAEVVERLEKLLGRGKVLLYPRDTRKLGATTNVQGRAVAATAQATFLHLELSRTMRNQLLQDSDLLRAFSVAVAGPGPGPRLGMARP